MSNTGSGSLMICDFTAKWCGPCRMVRARRVCVCMCVCVRACTLTYGERPGPAPVLGLESGVGAVGRSDGGASPMPGDQQCYATMRAVTAAQCVPYYVSHSGFCGQGRSPVLALRRVSASSARAACH